MKYGAWYKKHVVDKYGQEQVDLMRKMELYSRYKSVMGNELSVKSFAEFQDLKYNRVSKWENVKLSYKDEKL